MNPIKILIVDDHGLVRAGLRALLSSVSDVTVLGETGDGREAVALAARLKPDVVLMDISMGSLNGLIATEKIAKANPACHIIVLSMHTTDEYVNEAFRSGATGYLVKDSAATELEIAIRAAALGQRYISPAVAGSLIQHGVKARLDLTETPTLTNRQREILQLIAEGLTTKEIALALNLSAKTIETHRAQLMEKVGVHKVADLVRYAIKTGVTSIDR